MMSDDDATRAQAHGTALDLVDPLSKLHTSKLRTAKFRAIAAIECVHAEKIKVLETKVNELQADNDNIIVRQAVSVFAERVLSGIPYTDWFYDVPTLWQAHTAYATAKGHIKGQGGVTAMAQDAILSYEEILTMLDSTVDKMTLSQSLKDLEAEAKQGGNDSAHPSNVAPDAVRASIREVFDDIGPKQGACLAILSTLEATLQGNFKERYLLESEGAFRQRKKKERDNKRVYL